MNHSNMVSWGPSLPPRHFCPLFNWGGGVSLSAIVCCIVDCISTIGDIVGIHLGPDKSETYLIMVVVIGKINVFDTSHLGPPRKDHISLCQICVKSSIWILGGAQVSVNLLNPLRARKWPTLYKRIQSQLLVKTNGCKDPLHIICSNYSLQNKVLDNEE